MFQSSLKEAQAFQDFYLPKTGSYYRDNRNYSYDFTNKRNTTSLLSPYIRYRLLSEEDIIKKTLSINSFSKTEKFIQEIYWRTYWKGWLEHRPDVYNDYLMQQKQQRLNNSKSSSQFFDDYDNTSSIISIKNRPNTVQSLRREKQAQITMQTKRPRPSYGKKNTEIINERIERIRLARTKTANPTKKNPRDPKPLLSDFATSSSSGFLPGPKARRKLGRSARHANTANLAHRDIEQPQPKTFFQKEFAKHSNQSFTLSNNKNNSNQLLDGFEQLEGLRQRQLADMDRLLKEERAVEVERQAMEASDTSTKRRRRLRLKFMKDREKSRHRILRIAKEHELALANRMAAMGLIR